MNLVSVIEAIEIERNNNKSLGEAVVQRLRSLQEGTSALHQQALTFVQQLDAQVVAIHKAIASVQQEFADRDTALANLIGGE